VLQSILLQILIRESRGYTVQLHHVHSHLIDHVMDPSKKSYMSKQLIEQRMNKMKRLYGDKTQLYLTGNYHADIQCNQLTHNLWQPVNMRATVLPRFIVKHNPTHEIGTSAINHFIKHHQKEELLKEYLADHPDIEITKLSKEIDWISSIYPINNKRIHHHKSENFQYKLKTGVLTTPKIRFEQGKISTHIPALDSPTCPVCNSEEEADTTHIFTHCTVATQHNNQLWQDLTNIPGNTFDVPWFTVTNMQPFNRQDWNVHMGDEGYIPSAITHGLCIDIKDVLCQKVLESRHNLWKDYWKKFVTLIQTSQTTHSTGELPQQLPSGLGAVDLDPQQLYSHQQQQPQQIKRKQTSITSFFKRQ
jgi:hypothetical protein